MNSSSIPIKRLVPVALVLALAGVLAPARTAQSKPACAPRLLVLSAYPGEIDKNLTTAKVRKTVVIEDHVFYLGRLKGSDVILALTGIGLVNAERTTKLAFANFKCISGVVFSGVAGGRSNIGDVVVPARWTQDDGKHWFATDRAMLATARKLRAVALTQTAKSGDAVCTGQDPRALDVVRMPNVPKVRVGGNGKSTDPFGGRAFVCVPCGGDVFGCEPCRAQRELRAAFARFASTAPAFADPSFFTDYFKAPTPSSTQWDAEDMETAPVARVAASHKVPFIGFRGVSDGRGDPLNLPGFPAQFFVYRQLAADNAATTVQAFLTAWSRR